MSMKAQIMRDSTGNIVVQMQGDLTFDNSIPLREELYSIASRHPESEIHINMSGLDFVGSSGISHFVETIKILKTNCRQEIVLSNINPDFVRVFNLYGMEEAKAIMNSFDMDSENTAQLNIRFGNRRRTFEN